MRVCRCSFLRASKLQYQDVNLTCAISCSENFPGNDIQVRNTASAQACPDLCASLANAPSICEFSCNGAVFDAILTRCIPAQGGNHFLKSPVANGVLLDNGGFYCCCWILDTLGYLLSLYCSLRP